MSSQAISQVGSQIGPLLKQFVKQLGPQAASALKGIGKFATNNPELTNQLLATGLAAAAGAAGGSAAAGTATGASTGAATGSTQGAQGALQALTQIDPDVLQNIINSFYSQNRDNRCRDCVTLRKKKKSGNALTDAEKLLEEKACKACEDFCAALDRNPQLRKLDLCKALKELN